MRKPTGNKNRGIAAIAGLFLVIGIPSSTLAQSAEILAVVPSGTGARPIALGEAYHALGGDIHSLYYNPAGLGLARGLSIEGGLSHRATTLDTRYFGSAANSKVFNTGLDALGLVYAIPTERGSLVFALGAHRLRDLDNRYRIEGYNTSDDPDLGETWIEARDTDRGSLYGYSAGVGIEAAKGVYLGLNLEAVGGTNSYTYLLDAYDTDDVWTPYDGHRWDDGIDYTYNSKGLRLGFGMLWKPVDGFSLGGSLRLPSSIEITEEWYQSEVIYYDDDTYELTYEDDGVFTYDLRLPFEFGFGSALSFAGVTVAAGGSYIDYSQSWYSKAPYDGFPSDFFAENYKPQWKLGGGIEFATPLGAAVRAGYQWSPLQYRPIGQELVRNRESYSVGVGWLMGNSIGIDITYRTAQWETIIGQTQEMWNTGQFLLSFGYRF